MRRDERLALPQHRFDVEMVGELALEPCDDLLGL
jgi:hypothetical protein